MAVVLRPSEDRRSYVEEVLKILLKSYNIRCGRISREIIFSVYGRLFRLNAGNYAIILPEDPNKIKVVYEVTTKLCIQGIETLL